MYQVADFLGMDGLCRTLVRELLNFVKNMARFIQALSCNALRWNPNDQWALTFVECAALAYSLPDQRIRKPFLLFILFTRPFSGTGSPDFLKKLQAIPELLVDIIVMVDETSGTGMIQDDALKKTLEGDCNVCAMSVFRKSAVDRNLWVSRGKCFNCWLKTHSKDWF